MSNGGRGRLQTDGTACLWLNPQLLLLPSPPFFALPSSPKTLLYFLMLTGLAISLFQSLFPNRALGVSSYLNKRLFTPERNMPHSYRLKLWQSLVVLNSNSFICAA